MMAGYLAVKTRYLNSEIADSLNTFTVRFAVPVLLFRAIYNLDLENSIQWPILFGFYAGAIASFYITMWIAKIGFKRSPGEAVAVGFCAMFSNSVLLGIPIAERAFGSEILPLVYGIIAFHAPSLYIIGMISMEFSRSDGRKVLQTVNAALKSIFANSLMIGILSGALLNILEIPIPRPLVASINMVAESAIAVALIGIGASLSRYKMKSEMSETAVVSFMSLIVHPAIVFVITFALLDLQKEYVYAAVIVAAMPPGMNIYIFAMMYKRAVALSASALIGANIASIFTISAWIWVLSTLW